MLEIPQGNTCPESKFAEVFLGVHNNEKRLEEMDVFFFLKIESEANNRVRRSQSHLKPLPSSEEER